MHPHRRPLPRLTSLALLALTVACTDPAEEPHRCGISNDGARACQNSAVDLSARAQLGTIVDNGGGWEFVRSPSSTDPMTGEPVWAGDPRYGAVFVTNNVTNTDQSLRVKLTRLSNAGTEDDLGQVSRDTAACASEPCTRRWIDLLDDTGFIRVEVRPSADPTKCQPGDIGKENCPCDTNATTECESNTHCDGDNVCVQNFVELDTVPLFQADSDARTNIAANVVELNCEGVRDFSANELSGADYVGNPRHFVSVLERDAEGMGEIIVKNVSDPDKDDDQPWCVYSGKAEFYRSQCQSGEASTDWTWASGVEIGPPSTTDPTPQLTLKLGDDVDALAFEKGSCAMGPSSAWDLTKSDEGRARALIRVVDTTKNVVYFEELDDCATDHVPAAAPLVVTPDDAGNIQLINCTQDTITLCNASSGSCDPVSNPLITVDPRVEGEMPDTWTSPNECNHHALNWDDNGDPTVIVRKKKVDGCG